MKWEKLDKFVKDMIANSIDNISERIRLESSRKFHLRTSEFHHYLNPPMGKQ